MLIVTSGSCEIQRSVFIDIKLSAIAIVPILTLRHVARRTCPVDIPFQIYGDVCTKSHIRKSRSIWFIRHRNDFADIFSETAIDYDTTNCIFRLEPETWKSE